MLDQWFSPWSDWRHPPHFCELSAPHFKPQCGQGSTASVQRAWAARGQQPGRDKPESLSLAPPCPLPRPCGPWGEALQERHCKAPARGAAREALQGASPQGPLCTVKRFSPMRTTQLQPTQEAWQRQLPGACRFEAAPSCLHPCSSSGLFGLPWPGSRPPEPGSAHWRSMESFCPPTAPRSSILQVGKTEATTCRWLNIAPMHQRPHPTANRKALLQGEAAQARVAMAGMPIPGWGWVPSGLCGSPHSRPVQGARKTLNKNPRI